MAEVALAIVPVCLSALAGIKILRAKIRILRRHASEVQGVRRKFRVQADNFKDQLHRLLIESSEARGSLGRGKLASMAWDEDAPEWKSKRAEVEDSLSEYLGDKHEKFVECVGEVTETTRKMLGNLSVFAEPDAKVRWSKSTKDAFRIAFQKQDYTEQINVLKELVSEIKEIRKFAKFMSTRRNPDQRENTPPPAYSEATDIPQLSRRPSKERLLRRYKSSRKLLAEFLDVLLNHMSHGHHHSAKVMLRCLHGCDAEARMGFLLECVRQGQIPPNFIRFQVSRKSPLQQHYSGLLSPSTDSDRFSDPTARFDCSEPTLKRMRMSPPIEDGGPDPPPPDLPVDYGKGFCEVLAQTATPFPLGGLEFAKQASFSIGGGVGGMGGSSLAGRLTTLTELFELPLYDVVLDRHRVEVALMLVKGMLKSYSTRCWPRGCLLSSVKFYHGAATEEDLSADLNTLHLTADADNPGFDVDMEDDGLGALQDTAREKHGVHNMTLYSLGVALLQIGLWEEVPWGDVEEVRRKTGRLSYLGAPYHKITRQLINGTVGSCHSTVINEDVQGAVLDVIADLEGLLDLTQRPGRKFRV